MIQELEDENDEIEIDEDLLQQTKIVVTNILKEKVEPLILNDFEMYLRYNKIFLKVMEQRKKKISADESMKYMNDTLTWFCRSLSNTEDIFTVAGYILACPSNFYFVLLIKFFKEIDNKSKIKNLGKNVYKELLVIEKEFLEMENEVFNENKPVIKPRDMIIAGSVVALTVAILFGIFKKDK